MAGVGRGRRRGRRGERSLGRTVRRREVLGGRLRGVEGARRRVRVRRKRRC